MVVKMTKIQVEIVVVVKMTTMANTSTSLFHHWDAP
jgi:hypothetical protein